VRTFPPGRGWMTSRLGSDRVKLTRRVFPNEH
jgi:hypothetical protein